MYKKSVIKCFMLSVTMLAATAVPIISGANEQPDEIGNVVGIAIEVPNTPEVSNAITSTEVVIIQEDGTRGAVLHPRALKHPDVREQR